MATEVEMAPQPTAAGAPVVRPWDSYPLMDIAAYAAVAAGYLLGVLSARQVTLPGFVLFTAGNLLWIWIFRVMTHCDEGDVRTLRFACAAVAVTGGVLATAHLGQSFDWLLPIVTVGVLGTTLTERRAIALALITWTVTAASLAWLDSPFQAGHSQTFVQDQITLLPAFVFCFAFSFVVRKEQQQRARAEALVMQLEEAHAQLRAHADQVEELAVTRERNRMAREIHDTLGHYLTLLAVKLETALKLEERNDARLHDELAEARRVAAECLSEVRRSVAALRPADPTAASFSAALTHLAHEFEATVPETEVVLDVEGPAQALQPETRVALYRCAQESLTNIRKHAHASKVLVRLRVDGECAELTVLDNGAGAASGEDGHEPGFGLLGMRERIALLGGTVSARPEPGRGWRVDARVPIQSPVGGAGGAANSDVQSAPEPAPPATVSV